MITYKKKALKVENIYASYARGMNCTHYIAKHLKEFIEEGNYSRIADIRIYGGIGDSLVCSIIYEQASKAKDK